jgi:hypothetical protein
MPDLYQNIAVNANKDPIEDISMEDLMKADGYKPPVEDSKPIELTQTSDELIQKAPTPENKSFLERMFKNAAPNFAAGVSPSPSSVGAEISSPSAKEAPQMAKGAAQGTVGIMEMGAQLAYDIVDKGDDLAKHFGLTEEEMLSPYKVDWKSKFESPDDSPGTRLASTMVQYMAPGMAAAKAFKLGMIGAAGANIALDSILIDPNQERLSNMVLNSAPELRDYAVVGSMLKYLEHTDGEGNWEGRLKNGIESLIINSTFLAAPSIISGTVSGSAKVLNKGTEGAKKIANAFVKQIKTQQAVKTIEESISNTGKIAGATVENVEKVTPKLSIVPPVSEEVAKPGKSIFQSPLLSKNSPHYGKMYYRGTKDINEIIPSITHEETITKGKQIIADEKTLNTLLDKNPITEAYTPGENYAFASLQADASKELGEVLRNQKDLDLEGLVEAFDAVQASKGASLSEEAVGKVAGQTLESRKAAEGLTYKQQIDREMATFRKDTLDKAMQTLSPEQRKLAIEKQIELMGGEEKVRKFLEDLGHLTKDDMERIRWFEKIASEGTLPKMGRALNYAMYGSMLGVKSVGKAMLSNTVSTGFNMLDQMGAVAISSSRKMFQSDKFRALRGLEPLSQFEKSADTLRYNAIQKGYSDGLRNAFASFGRPEEIPYRSTKLGIYREGLTPLENMGITHDDSLALQTFGHIASTVGMRGVVGKALGKADMFYGSIVYGAEKSVLVHDLAYNEVNAMVKAGTVKPDKASAMYEKLFAKHYNDPPMTIHKKAMDTSEQLMGAKEIPAEAWIKKMNINGDAMMNHIFPFVKVGYNSAMTAFEHSPLAFSSPEIRRQLFHGTQLEKDMALSKIMVGTTALGALTSLAIEGKVTGPVSPNYRENQALRDSGKEPLPNSIMGVSFDAIDIARPFLSLSYIMAQSKKYMSKEEYDDLAIATGGAIAGFFTSSQLLENISAVTDLVEAVSKGDVNDEKQAYKFMSDYFGRYVPRVPQEASGTYAQNIIGDPYKHRVSAQGEALKKSNELIEEIKLKYLALNPYFNKDLPVLRNLLGEPQLFPAGIGPDVVTPMVESRGQESELMQKLRILSHASTDHFDLFDEDGQKLTIAMPGKVIRIPQTTKFMGIDDYPVGGQPGMPFELSAKQYDQYMEAFGNLHEGAIGPTLRQQLEYALADNSPLWRDLTKKQSPNEYRKAVSRVYEIFSDARKRANVMIMQDPEFREEYDKKRDRYTNDEKQFIKPIPKMLGQ